MKPNADDAVQLAIQSSPGAKAPRYGAFQKKSSPGTHLLTAVLRASFAGRGSRKVTGRMSLPPLTTSGPRVIAVMGDRAGSTTLLLAGSRTPTLVASVYAFPARLL